MEEYILETLLSLRTFLLSPFQEGVLGIIVKQFKIILRVLRGDLKNLFPQTICMHVSKDGDHYH